MIEILLGKRQRPVYPAQSISWLLMAWQYEESGYQQPCYEPRLTDISSILSSDFRPLTVVSVNFRVISWSFYEVITANKHCGRNRIDHEYPCGMEFTLVCLYSTEITRYGSWFLQYKLTRANSVAARAPMMDSLIFCVGVSVRLVWFQVLAPWNLENLL